MKTKVVYVITSTPKDIYLEQTYVSVYSLRKHNKDAHVVLLTDDKTNETLTGNRAKILELITEKKVVEFDKDMSNLRRSRYLKTSMRNIVDGDFIYIDGDTIINAPLDELDSFKDELCAVDDAHMTLDKHFAKADLLRRAKTLGFNIESEIHNFNGGVMYVKDTPKTREFFSKWHENWKRSMKKGINLDMPALMQTNIEMGHIIKDMGGQWNCQIYFGFTYMMEAKIIHYFASMFSDSDGTYAYFFTDPKSFDILKNTGNISSEMEGYISKPLLCFKHPYELIGGTDVYLHSSRMYTAMKIMYNKIPKLFKLIENTIYQVNRVRKGWAK